MACLHGSPVCAAGEGPGLVELTPLRAHSSGQGPGQVCAARDPRPQTLASHCWVSLACDLEPAEAQHALCLSLPICGACVRVCV